MMNFTSKPALAADSSVNFEHLTSKHILFKPRACPLYRLYLVWGA